MLHIETVQPDTLGLLKRIQSLPVLSGARLVGGTALALQLGHRESIVSEKVSDGLKLFVMRSLVYFNDAEDEPMPVMLKPLNWETAKERIRVAVRRKASE